ncbi:hypothetical protein D3C85_1519390 [compost metagenome]
MNLNATAWLAVGLLSYLGLQVVPHLDCAIGNACLVVIPRCRDHLTFPRRNQFNELLLADTLKRLIPSLVIGHLQDQARILPDQATHIGFSELFP